MRGAASVFAIVQFTAVLLCEHSASAAAPGESADGGTPAASATSAPPATPSASAPAPLAPPAEPGPTGATQAPGTSPPVAAPGAPPSDVGSGSATSFGDAFSAVATDANLLLKMYGDTGFAVRDNAYWPWATTATSNPGAYSPGVWNSFFAPRIDLFGSADVNKLSFLTEVMFEGNHNEISVDLERVQLTYLIANWLRIRAGRTHLAWGYYNDTYHHGNLFELTTSRPYSVQFEDSGGIILAHNVGVGADGTFGDGLASFRYDVEVGNGRGADLTAVALEYAEKNQKSVNVRLRWMPLDGLIVGVNGMRAVVPALLSTATGVPSRPDTEELVAGAHVVYTEHSFIVDVEGFAMRHNPSGAPSDDIFGGFAEVGYTIGAFTPYLRPEYMRFPSSPDIIYQYSADDVQGQASGGPSPYTATRDFADLRVGVKWAPVPQLAFKLEVERLSHDTHGQDIATAKAAFGF